MEHLTKLPEVYAVPDQSAATTVCMCEIFFRFRVPEELYSDQGPNLEAQVFTEVYLRIGVRKMRTTPLNPQSEC